MKLSLFTTLKVVAVLGVLIPAVSLAQSPGGIPHQFYGTVVFESSGAPDGLAVQAKVNGVVVGSSTTSGGNYGYNPNLLFALDSQNVNEGKTVKFFVAGAEADQTSLFSNGKSAQLNLTVPGSIGIIEAEEDDVIENQQVVVTPDNPTNINMGDSLSVTISSEDSQSVTITKIEKLQSNFFSGNLAIITGNNLLNGYEIDIEGDVSIEITLKYSDDGINESSIKPHYHDGSEWVEIADSTVNTSANTVTFTIESANTPYVIFGEDAIVEEEAVSNNTSGGGGGGGGGSEAETPTTPASPLSAAAQKVDANKDGKIDVLDFNTLMVNWGSTSANNVADFDGNGKVDVFDFNLLMINWTL